MNKSIFTIVLSTAATIITRTSQKDGSTGIYEPLCVARIQFKTILKPGTATDFSSRFKVT